MQLKCSSGDGAAAAAVGGNVKPLSLFAFQMCQCDDLQGLEEVKAESYRSASSAHINA